jgi:uncharacterized membrane protein
MSLADKDKETARKKGVTAALVTGGAVAVAATVSPIVGVIALVPAAYFVRDWFMFRAKRGMRF